MFTGQQLVSWLYYGLFMLYAYLSTLISRIEPVSARTRVLTFSFVSVTLWAVFASFANAAPDMQSSLVFRKLAVLGWGTVYSLILHLCLLLTGKTKWLRRPVTYVILYLPAVLNIFAFLIRWNAADAHFHLVRYQLGWNNLWVNTFWNWFQVTHYVLFSLFSVMNVTRWYFRTKDPEQKRQAGGIALSFTLALALGGITDYVTEERFNGSFPQLGIVFVLIPMVAILVLSLRHNLAQAPLLPADRSLTNILNDEARQKLYSKIGYLVIFVSFFNLGHRALVINEYTTHNLLVMGLVLSNLMVLLAIVIFNAQRLGLRIPAQEILISAVLTGILIAGVLIYGEDWGTRIWFFIFVPVVLSTVFHAPLVLLSGITLVTVVILVGALGDKGTQVQEVLTWFIPREAAFVLTAGFALYINRIYKARIAQNAASLKFQKAVADFSLEVAEAGEGSFDRHVAQALDVASRYLKARAVAYVEIDQRTRRVKSYRSRGLQHQSGIGSELEQTAHGSLISEYGHYDLGPVYFTNIEDCGTDSVLGRHMLSQGSAAIAFTLTEPRVGTWGVLAAEYSSPTNTMSTEAEDYMRLALIGLSGYFVRHETEQELIYQAHHDSLTGLLKREALLQKADQLIALAEPGQSVAMVIVDINAFKDVNDTAGHNIGNQALRAIADRLGTLGRQGELVGRMSGDSFLYAVPLPNAEALPALADDLLALFDEPFVVETYEFHLTASLGIATYPAEGTDAASLYNNADFAISEAKGSQGNAYAVYAFEKRNAQINALAMKGALHTALDNEEMYLVYQPQVNLHTGRIAGVEALLRWKHPEMGHVSPGIFIPLAEQLGLVGGIGEWVLQQACAQARLWQEAGYTGLQMGINLSFLQLLNPSLPDTVAAVLTRYDINPQGIEIEITESTTGIYGDRILHNIAALKRMGLSLAIDDYGSDYSAIRRLSVFDIDRIKIDKSLIDGVAIGDAKREIIVQNIITLAHELHIDVLAEGVETEAQVMFLKSAGCNAVQGYHFFKPMSPEDVSAQLQKEQAATTP